MSTIRIGYGYDVHALAAGNGLVLGGVTISCNLCFIAHSDGEVLIHALGDALLGAVAKGDIGFHFSDQDIANKNRDSP
jgi:2-C-methyl-D-erythritol 2,4-cyclodiphosphate synthase